MNGRRQRRVLYREFLFRIVDREMLASHSTGDASQLLLQLLTLLLGLSVLFSAPALFIDAGPNPQAQLMLAWSVEHFLIATTMLTVGVFAVLGWGSMLPDQRDILVLAPLPVRAHTILVAKIAALGTSLAATVLALHAVTSLVWPLTLISPDGGVGAWLRLFVAYWLTMFAAGLFVFGVTAGLQGVAAAVLPHRHFLRVSPVLQLGVFCVLVGTYFLQPMVVTASAVLDAQRSTLFGSSPSIWFLGLFQAVNGSPALALLAERAVAGLIVAVVSAVGVCGFSYVRTLRRMSEEPDVAPVVRTARQLPSFGNALHTAIVHFSARTLLRSTPHRVIFAFYLGIGFALSAVFLKTPRAQELAENATAGTWDDTSMPLIVSSVVMMACAVVGARLTFAMPRDLPANWIFRILPVRGGARYVSARRSVFIILAAGPVWLLSACVFLATWPWIPALGHLIILAMLGAILVELSLSRSQGIPFTCAYVPGQSRSHVTAPFAVVLLLVLAVVGADVERRVLQAGGAYAAIVSLLALVWVGARWRTSWLADAAAPDFEDEAADRVVSLGLWDSRVPSGPVNQNSAPR